MCATCGTVIRGYACRFYPPGSRWFERCLGLAWCPGCRIYTTSMVHVPREKILADALAGLPADEQERLRRSERRLVAYLDSRTLGGEADWR